MTHLPALRAIYAILGIACVFLAFPVLADDRLKIGVLNLEWFGENTVERRGAIGRLPARKQNAALFSQAVEAAAEIIRVSNPDVLVLTEVGSENDVRRLHRAVVARQPATGRYHRYDAPIICRCPRVQRGLRLAVFLRKDVEAIEPHIAGRRLFQSEESDVRTESDTGLNRSLKIVLSIGPTENIVLYAVHFQSERGGHERDNRRMAQAELLRSLVEADIKNGLQVIVAGDLNADVGSRELLEIRGWNDNSGNLLQPAVTYENNSTFSRFFQKEDDAIPWTHRFRDQLQQLDHILLSSNTKTAWDKAKVEWIDWPKELPRKLRSDHRLFSVSLTR